MNASRVHFHERQLLLADDLHTEQAYRIRGQQRHNETHHSWGIVYGLKLAVAEDSVIVEPGMAVDVEGRELLVLKPIALPSTLFSAHQHTPVNVWMDFHQEFDAESSTWLEGSYLSLRLANVDIDPKEAFEKLQERSERPIFLGNITYHLTVYLRHEFLISDVGRRYAKFAGESLISPSEKVRMRIGNESADERARFEVSLRDEMNDWSNALTIDRKGNVFFNGSVELSGLLTVTPNPNGVAALEFEERSELTTEAMPWQFYRVNDIQKADTPNESDLHQLRVEIENPGKKGEPQRFQFLIGHGAAHSDGVDATSSNFSPTLKVMADGTVVAMGDLLIEGGYVVESPIDADIQDVRFNSLLLNSFTQSMSAAATQSDAALTAALKVTISDIKSKLATSDTAIKVGNLQYNVTIENLSDVLVPNIQIFELLISDETQTDTLRYSSGVNQVNEAGKTSPINIELLKPLSPHTPIMIDNSMVKRPPFEIEGQLSTQIARLIVMVQSMGPGVYTLAYDEKLVDIIPTDASASRTAS